MRYVIWDFDGTLAYREGGWSGACVEVIGRTDATQDIGIDDIRPYLDAGFPWHTPNEPHTEVEKADEWWERLYPVLESAMTEAGLSPTTAVSLAPRVRETYLTEHWHLFEDVIPTFKSLANEGWSHLVLSNHVPELEWIIDDLGVSGYLDAVYTSASIGYEKPHPEAFKAVMHTLEADATACMIGDSVEADILGARHLELPAILVRDDHPEVQYAVENLHEVPALLSAVLDD